MNRTIHFILGGLLLLSFGASCSDGGGKSSPATTAANTSSDQDKGAAGLKTPPADIVLADASAVEMAAGGAAEASVRLTIADGYHISANPATLSYQIATQLNVEPGEGITAGKPVYPSSVMRKFAFEPQPFAVYEGAVTIKLPLRAEAGASAGARSLRARLRVQPCDEQACYPPRTINASIPVNVK